MSMYGNYIEESSLPNVCEEDILNEGAGLDLYNKFKEAKKYYREKDYELNDALDHGEIKQAKNIIKEVIDHLVKLEQEIKAIDDSEFRSKVGIFGIKVFEFLGNSIIDIFANAGVSAGTEIVKNKVFAKAGKEAAKKLTKKMLAGSAAIGALAGIAVPLSKEIMSQIKTHEKMQYKISLEMKKNHKSEEEAKKAVGTIYKNEILDYISDIVKDYRRLDAALKV